MWKDLRSVPAGESFEFFARWPWHDGLTPWRQRVVQLQEALREPRMVALFEIEVAGL